MNKETKTLEFEGEETTKRGPGYNHPLAIAARERQAKGLTGTGNWVEDVISLSPSDRINAFGNKH